MAKNDVTRMYGKISAVIPGGEFKVKLDNGHELLGHVSGKMRKYYIKLTTGDDVTVEISSYDLTKCRIVFRGRVNNRLN